MDVADVLKSLRRHWRLSVAVLVVAGLGLTAFLHTKHTTKPTPRWRVTSDVVVPSENDQNNNSSSQDQTNAGNAPIALLRNPGNLALDATTEQRALRESGIPVPDYYKIIFGVSVEDSTKDETGATVTLIVTGPTSREATAVATAYGTAFQAARKDLVASISKTTTRSATQGLSTLGTQLVRNTTELNRQDPAVLAGAAQSKTPNGSIDPTELPLGTTPAVQTLVVEHNTLIDHINSLRETLAENEISTTLPRSFLQTVSTTTPNLISASVTETTPIVPAATFLGIGLLVALAAPVLIDRLDRSIRTPRAASLAFDAAVLTSVPAPARNMPRALAAPGTAADGAYRSLAATSVATDRLSQAILVMSPTGNAQDMVAANYAAALAGLGLRVALIATDARQSWFADAGAEPVGSDGGPALTFPELLDLAHRGRLNGSLSRGLVPTHHPNLLVVPPGAADADISFDGLRPLLEALRSGGVDVTVIAGPAFLEDPAATILAWTTRSVLWAFRVGEVTEAEAREAASRLTLAGAESFGIAMVGGKD
jgi:Mrp family chromosome partitioning ATPase